MPLVESFSGIRGIYDDGIDEKVAVRYGYAYLSFLKKKHGDNVRIVLGTDTRPSKDMLKNALIESLNCEIIDLDIASTPMVEFAVRHYKADGGVVVTASHNEPYWNGFKFLGNDGGILKPEHMDKVIKSYNKIKNLPNKKVSSKEFSNNGLYKNINPKDIRIKKVTKKYDEINRIYSDYVLSFLQKEDRNIIKNSGLKVIIDPNGGTGAIAKMILERLGLKVIGTNMNHGIFNRAIEPNEDSLLYLSNIVRDKNYDFAAGFDCDADRVEIMTGSGIISGNHILALIADNILKNAKNKSIVVNDATSLVVRDIAKKHKARYAETQVGEANVVSEMYRLKAPVGGEGSSGGVIIPDSRCRDGILTLLLLIKIISKKGERIEELAEELPKYSYIKTKVNINTSRHNLIINKLLGYYKKKGCRIKKTKGGSLKVMLGENSFAWFRASKTEAGILRVIADSPEKSKTEAIIAEALNLLK